MAFIIFKAALHFNGHMLFQVLNNIIAFSVS